MNQGWTDGYRIGVFAVMLLALTTVAAGTGVSLGVTDQVEARFTVVTQSLPVDAPKQWTTEAVNTGSEPFTARVRLDVVNATNETVFRTWSDHRVVEPGASMAPTLTYTDPERSGNLTARLVLHYGAERLTREVPFETVERETEDGFSLSRVTGYADHVRVGVAAPDAVESFVVTLNDRASRRFVQQQVTDASGHEQVRVPYAPAITDTEQVKITISEIEGRYHYTEDVGIAVNEGVGAVFARFRDWIAGVVGR